MAAVVAAVALVTGCSGDEEATTVTVVETDVTTVTVIETRALASPRVSAKPKRGELSFRGNGDRTLPPLRVRRGGTTIRWANDGPVFSLIGQKGIIVDSVARSGSTYLPAGRQMIEVVAAGTWTLTIPRARRAS